MPKSVLKDDALYLGDGGHCFCGRHAGMTARFTGRDLSGQRVYRLTATDIAETHREYGVVLRCEMCPPPAAGGVA